jgi:SSS family solute:Na+ symporter
MHPADATYAVLIVSLALIGLGIAGMRSMRASRGKGLDQYFLGGHTVSWIGLASSFFVTSIWGMWCVGWVLSLHSDGWAWSILGLCVALGLVLLGAVFALTFRERSVLTISDFLAGRSERISMRTTLSAAFVLLTLFIRIPITIVLGGKLLHGIFGWDPVTAALLMIVVPGVFAVAGGYAAAFAIQGGAAVAAVTGLIFLGSAGSMDAVFPPGSLLDGNSPESMLLFSGLLVYGLWSTCADQSAIQRVAAACSSRDPRKAAFAAAGAVALGGLAIGVAAARVPTPLQTGALTGLARAIVGTSLLTSAMAALAGQFLSVSTMCTLDLYRRFRSAADEAVLVLVGRLMTTMAVVFSILATSLLALIGDQSVLWLTGAYILLGVPVAAIALVGFTWARHHVFGVISGLVIGCVVGSVQVAVKPELMLMPAGLLWMVITVFVSTVLAMIAFSVLAASGVSIPGVLSRRVARMPKS